MCLMPMLSLSSRSNACPRKLLSSLPAINFNQSAEDFENEVNANINQYANTVLVDIDEAEAHLTNSIANATDFVLDLNGTTWRTETFVVKVYVDQLDGQGWQFVRECGDYVFGTGMYEEATYGKSTVTVKIKDYYDSSNCRVSENVETGTFPYSSNSLCASHKCTYSELNKSRLVLKWDTEDNRYEGFIKAHVLGSNEIRIKKTIVQTITGTNDVTANHKRVLISKATRIN